MIVSRCTTRLRTALVVVGSNPLLSASRIQPPFGVSGALSTRSYFIAHCNLTNHALSAPPFSADSNISLRDQS